MTQVTTKTLRAFRMNSVGAEVLSSIPKTLPMPIPSITEQVHNLTRLGTARADAYWEDNHDWNDHLDDLPNEGTTEHEINGSEELQYIRKPKKPKPSSKPPKTPPLGAEKAEQIGDQVPPSAEQSNSEKK